MLSFQKEGVRAAWKPVLVLALSTRSRRSFGMEEQMTDRTCPVPSGGPASLRQVEEAVRREFDAGLFTGAVVLLGDRERVLYHEAFGLAQVEPEPVAMRRDSIFDVASVTKVVATATACAICVDEGRLDPDAPLTDYIPDHRGRGVERITLRHLASHTSGFGAARQIGRRASGDAFFQALLDENPTREPGTRHEYACYNAILLGIIVERVTGMRFGEFCTRRIFRPLGMSESVFNVVPPSERVVGGPRGVPLGLSHNLDSRMAGRAIGNAGLFTTAADLARFARMMLGGGELGDTRILSERVIDDVTQPWTGPDFPEWGFLWCLNQRAEHRPSRLSPRAYGHGGFTGQSLWIDPEQGLFLLVLTNRIHPEYGTGCKPEQDRARARIADALLEVFA